MAKSDELAERIENCIILVNALISNFTEDKASMLNFSLSQLMTVRRELDYMRRCMDPRAFYPSYGRLIAESWEYEEEIELRLMLMKIESDYIKLEKQR